MDMDDSTGSELSTLEELQKEFKSLEKVYEKCSTLYKRVESILSDNGVDKLTLAILQQYLQKAQDKSLSWRILNNKKHLDRVSKTLRIGVIGEVAAGKTSLVNNFLGDDFLPVDQGICTKVLCEICNSDFRRVEVYCSDDSFIEKLLENDPDSKNWKWLRKVIEDGTLYCESSGETVDVTSVKIYWPLDLFQETLEKITHDECDSIEGERKTPAKHKFPSVIFLDFQGLDDTDAKANEACIQKIVQDATSEEVDGLIFVIDQSLNNGMNENTIGNVMSQLIHLHDGSVYDSDKTLFICNKWDMVSKKEHKQQELRQTTFDKIRSKLPCIQESQIVQFSCIKKINENVAIHQLYHFLRTVKKRKLEEYLLWLTNVCDVAVSLMKSGRSWCMAEKVLVEIRTNISHDVQLLRDVKADLMGNGKLILAGKIEKMQARYKLHLETELRKYQQSSIIKANEKHFDKDLETARLDFSENFNELSDDINSWFRTLQASIKDQSRLLRIFNKHGNLKSYTFDILLFASVLFVPVVKIVLIGKFMLGEVDELKLRSFSYRIQRELDFLELQCGKITENFIKLLEKHINMIENIDKLDICPSDETLVNELSRTIDDLLVIFLANVATHEINPADVQVVETIEKSRHSVHEVKHKYHGTLARKVIQTDILHTSGEKQQNRSVRTQSVSYKVLCCRELLLLRKIRKVHTDPLFVHFVKYYGSSLVTDKSSLTLHLFMERCDRNLQDHLSSRTLSYQERLVISVGAAKAVKFLHQNGIIHRDIKPQNFLVKDGIIKICDVGHSKEEDKNTTTGHLRGTTQYHAPEITRGFLLHTTKSDIYSLGLVFAEIWNFRNMSGVPNIVFRNDITIPDNVRSVVKKVISACISQKSEDRPNIYTVLKNLEAVIP